MGRVKDRAVITSLKLLPKSYMSHVAGKLAATRLPKRMRKGVVRAFGSIYGVNFGEVADPLDTFLSVQSFFTRALREGARPVDPAPDAFVSPCDGAWGAAGVVDNGTALQVKGRSYSIDALLDEPGASRAYEGGAFATLYLSPRDYHRFHAPCAGDVESARHVPGALWPVNSAGIRHVDGLFAKNERLIAFLRPHGYSDARLAMIAVGATMVGKVRVSFDDLHTNRRPHPGGKSETRRYDPPKKLGKGEEWGRFEFGSTIVLVATPGWLRLDAQAPGTPLLLGRAIGRMT